MKYEKTLNKTFHLILSYEIGGVMTELLSHRGAHSLDFSWLQSLLWFLFSLGLLYWHGIWSGCPTPLLQSLDGSELPLLPTEKGGGKSKLMKPKPTSFPMCCWIGCLSAGHCSPSVQDRGSLVGRCASALSPHPRLGCGSLPNSYVVIFGDRVFTEKTKL